MKTRNLFLLLLSVGTLSTSLATENPDANARIASPSISRKEYRSPKGGLIATVLSLPQTHRYGGEPSRIEIRDQTGHLLAERDHSIFPNQGLVVTQAAWTKDGRFFVYQTEESGGHQPWHHPTYFYSRSKHHFYSLDDALGALGGTGDGAITDGIQFLAPATLATMGRFRGSSRQGLHVVDAPKNPNGDRVLKIDLRWLEAHLSPKALSSDDDDRKEKALEDRENQ